MHRQIAGKLTSRVTKWPVAVAWIVIFMIAGAFAQKLTDVQDNEASSWLPSSAESTKALDKLTPFQDPNDIPTVVVYHRTGGLTTADLSAITGQVAQIQEMKGVRGTVVGPTTSQDGDVATTLVTFNFGKNGWNDLPDTADALKKISAISGVEVRIAGQGGQAADSANAFAGLDGTLLFATLGVVILILLFTYRSPILWILPILSSVVALFTAEGLIYFLAKDAGLTVNGQSQGILTVLVIGAGTDYALLLVARYREELRRHEDRHEAMAFALHRASPAILASAATVAIGMLCLTLAEMNSTAGLGPVLAIGVVVTLAVMLTLLPALLVIFGRWMFWPKRPTFNSSEPTAEGLWAKVGNRIKVRPRAVWVGTAVVLLVACLGLFKLDTGGLNSSEQYTKEFDSIKGQKLMEEHGLADTSSPIMVVTSAAKAQAVADAIATVPGAEVPAGGPPPVGGVALITVPVQGDPAAQSAFDEVKAIRSAVHQVDGADALVGGTSAIYLDIQTASHHDNVVIIPVVLVVVTLILMLLLRAVLSPLLLLGTVILSFGAALGISSAVFDHLFGYPGEPSTLPLLAFIFLVALGVDYNIFLMARAREEALRHGTRHGMLRGLAVTGGVITSAGIVLAGTFTMLATLPLKTLTELGFTIAFGVLLDTFIVRSVLVPALVFDIGPRVWWPNALARKGETLDTQGEAGSTPGTDEHHPERPAALTVSDTGDGPS